MKELPLDDRFKKVISVINSCTTYQQLQAAVTYSKLFLKAVYFKKEYRKLAVYNDLIVAYTSKQKTKVQYGYKVNLKSLDAYYLDLIYTPF